MFKFMCMVGGQGLAYHSPPWVQADTEHHLEHFHSPCQEKRTLRISHWLANAPAQKGTHLTSCCCCWVTKLYPALGISMDCSMPGSPVLHYLPEFAQTHVHWACDAIQPSHPLSSPSPPALHLSQHQGLFQRGSLHISWPKYWGFSFSNSPSNEY